MIFLSIIGVVIVMSAALAAVYDHRARHHGWRTGPAGATRRATSSSLDPFAHRGRRFGRP